MLAILLLVNMPYNCHSCGKILSDTRRAINGHKAQCPKRASRARLIADGAAGLRKLTRGGGKRFEGLGNMRPPIQRDVSAPGSSKSDALSSTVSKLFLFENGVLIEG